MLTFVSSSPLLIHSSHLYSSINTFVHPTQSLGRWLVQYGVVMRLAWDLTPQYPIVSYAMWSRCQTGVGGEETGSRKEDEEKVGGRLERM